MNETYVDFLAAFKKAHGSDLNPNLKKLILRKNTKEYYLDYVSTESEDSDISISKDEGLSFWSDFSNNLSPNEVVQFLCKFDISTFAMSGLGKYALFKKSVVQPIQLDDSWADDWAD